jgi:hypothetical protein
MGYLKAMKMLSFVFLCSVLIFSTTSCQENTVAPPLPAVNNNAAAVTDVKVSGTDNDYSFTVTVKSPDTGCKQYANWWEVISADGKGLVYRRILAHSHIDEQPFTRSGGPVAIAASTEVIIRVHMNSTGYGTAKVMKGSVDKGFTAFDVAADFGAELASIAPQPGACPF